MKAGGGGRPTLHHPADCLIAEARTSVAASKKQSVETAMLSSGEWTRVMRKMGGGRLGIYTGESEESNRDDAAVCHVSEILMGE